MTRPATAYKVLTAPQMGDLEAGSFEGAPIDIQDGYIHLSTAAQLTETVDKHFADEPNLWVAAIDLEALGDTIKWEVSRGGAEFPHLYGALTLETVVAYSPLERTGDGSVALPVTG
jgi:uncharacterized protein (DUF952 family)